METPTRRDAGAVDFATGAEPGAGSTVGPEGEAGTPSTGGEAPEAALRRRVRERLRREGYRFDFFQAVRLLELLQAEGPPGAARRSGDAGAHASGVRIAADPALAFPASDVRRIRLPEAPGGDAEVQVTFMGLYGVSSPLPEFFYDLLPSSEARALQDFLDLFGHRIYTFFYRAWKQARPELYPAAEDAAAAQGNPHARRFLALSGLGTPHAVRQTPVPRRLLTAFAGRLLPRARGAEGLCALLRGWLDLPVGIEENVPRHVTIRDRPRLGSGMQLGRNAVVGERVLDLMGKFRLDIGPMDRADFLSLLPRGERAGALAWLVRAYLPGSLDFDVRLRLRAGELPRTRLGDPVGRLGLTTCLGTLREPVLTRIVDYAPND